MSTQGEFLVPKSKILRLMKWLDVGSYSQFSDSNSNSNNNTQYHSYHSNSDSLEDTEETYVDDNSLEEVEAVLGGTVEDSIEDTLQQWNTPAQHSSERLSRITEVTEDLSSRHSGSYGHSRSATEPSATVFTPPMSSPPMTTSRTMRRAGDLIAYFEERSAADPSTISRTATSSPFTQSRTFASLTGGDSYTRAATSSPFTQARSTLPSLTRTGTPAGTTTSRPNSPTKSTFSSMTSPSRYSAALPSIPGDSTYAASTTYARTSTLPSIPPESRYSGSYTSSRPGSPSKTTFLSPPITITTSSYHTPPTGPGSPSKRSGSSALSSVRNIVAAWKERTPTGKGSKSGSSSTGGGQTEGFFSIRRRARERELAAAGASTGEFGAGTGGASDNGQAPPVPEKTPRAGGSPIKRSGTISSSTAAPSFDIGELGPYARRSQEVRDK